MAPVPGKTNTMEHFTHPGHQLFKLQSTTEYLCDGCKTEGSGTKFRCHPCDFDIHEYCATCPRVLSTFMHPHPLSLVQRSAQATIQRTCDVCCDDVKGLFYRCKGCEFDVHPVCTQLPQKVSHNYHWMHPLTLQAAPAGWFCGVCAGPCGTSLRYRCGACNFDIHPKCIVILGPETATRSATPQFGTPQMPFGSTTGLGPRYRPPMPFGSTAAPPPPYGGYPYGAAGVGSSSGNPNNMYNYMNQGPNNAYNYSNPNRDPAIDYSMNPDPNNAYNYSNPNRDPAIDYTMNPDPNNVYSNMNQHVQAGGATIGSGNGTSMFAVVGKLVGAFANMTTGTDFSSFM